MPIVPDLKDWTWVLERPCPDCGFDVRNFVREDIATVIRANAGAWPELLREDGAHRRPSEDRWSTLEYACHVRDVFKVFAGRLAVMRAQDSPSFPDWDQDATALEQRYWAQNPGVVATQLVAAAETLAEGFASVRDEEWSRPGTRSNGSRFSVETLGLYLIHDPIHHLFDVTGVTAP